MKTKFLMLLFGLLVIPSYAQKNNVYLNDDLVKISETEYSTTNNSPEYFNIHFELDTSFVHVKVQRIKKGKISQKQFNALKSELAEISGTSIPDKNVILINYYHGQDACNATIKQVKPVYKKFLRKLKKVENVSQIFMYKSLKGAEEYSKNFNWINDRYSTIENTFLPLHYPCGSYVMIDNEGNYFVHKGEYNIFRIIEFLHDQKNTFDQTKSARLIP